MPLYKQMTVIGVGLLGGSLALAARKWGMAETIIGFGRNQDTLQRAKDQGVIDGWAKNIADSVKDSDLVVLCSPVGTFIQRVKELLPGLKPGCHITDVGSVKGQLVSEIEQLLPEDIHYVGAHPIAGGEKSGLQAARVDLLRGARCIVTPTANTSAEANEKVMQFWAGLGMEVIEMDPAEHDFILGAVSHLPHVVAYALMNTVGSLESKEHGEVVEFSGGGLRDITRIASSDPVMWRDICLHNREQVLALVDQFLAQLTELRDQIDRGEADSIEQSYALANQHRLKLAGVNE